MGERHSCHYRHAIEHAVYHYTMPLYHAACSCHGAWYIAWYMAWYIAWHGIWHDIWHGICVSPPPGAGSDGLPPPTRTMAWHGMLYGMVYGMVYSMLYGMVYVSPPPGAGSDGLPPP